IAEYENPARDAALDSPRAYAVGQTHKHMPEITHVCGLSQPPIFLPLLADYPCGMLVSLPLPPGLLKGKRTLAELTALYRTHYEHQSLMRVLEPNPEPFVAANALAGSDVMEIFLTGTDDRIIACARFDNLGKGASGAAIQCMNLMMGLPAATGLATEP
ncbi:MAG: N-acetyl-gamma-glutamyl-phosphate reductase, partial [Eubacteriales bacterium]|nr:N-acetyl-gamma-glutamyl-phosphate reductase [Eubacteriales bacterium]